ncbi:hypothetical protein DPMN_186177 [Dreissena polymorpha]|uniref:Uncharacterized protein n=1 Tax=Dreissena polymorpha TaxID=45954 RepID=A0A9D4DQ02_DREPO|nr:hypothetical protein DPMN_186177 [Dreissena polymorpha]
MHTQGSWKMLNAKLTASERFLDLTNISQQQPPQRVTGVFKRLQYFTNRFHIWHIGTLHGPLPVDEV